MPHDDTMFIKSNVDVLAFMEPEQLRKITPDIEHTTYHKGEPVLFKGEITEGFYIVKKGSAQAVRKAGDVVDLKAGDFFGEVSLIGEIGSVETIKSLEDGTEIAYASEVSVFGRLGKFGLGIMKKKARDLGQEFAETFREKVEGG